jgi:hypothetical protein
MPDKFDLTYLFTGEGIKDWYKALGAGWRIGVMCLLGFLLLSGIRGCFTKVSPNVNKPHVIVTPFAKVEKIDQSNVQISMTEKNWELSLGMGVMRYDNKDGVIMGGTIKRKF